LILSAVRGVRSGTPDLPEQTAAIWTVAAFGEPDPVASRAHCGSLGRRGRSPRRRLVLMSPTGWAVRS